MTVSNKVGRNGVMAVQSPEFHGEVFDTTLQKAKEYSPEERTSIAESTRLLVQEYMQSYSEFGTNQDWRAHSARLAETAERNDKIIEQRFDDRSQRLLKSVNALFGKLPENFVQSQLLLNGGGGPLDRQQTAEYLLKSAAWQGEAVRALFALPKVRTDESGSTVLDNFFTASRQIYRAIGVETNQAAKFEGTMRSGLYGPVALASYLHKHELSSALPLPEDDVRFGIDLYYGQKTGEALPERIYLAQVKSQSSNEDGLDISTNPGSLMTSEQRAWEAMQLYAQTQNASPQFHDSGVDFLPVWATITHAGLNDADEWRNGLEYLLSSDQSPNGELAAEKEAA